VRRKKDDEKKIGARGRLLDLKNKEERGRLKGSKGLPKVNVPKKNLQGKPGGKKSKRKKRWEDAPTLRIVRGENEKK